ncbi:MAG TPA: M28 family peptidase [Anaerolineales bacterium]|nr:M28 family peptidase [Anaerolineales bacterium]
MLAHSSLKAREATRTRTAALGLVLGTLLSACASEIGATAAFNGGLALDAAAEQVAFGPRFPGSPGHTEIQEWIARELEARGWAVERQAFEYAGVPLLNLIATRSETKGPFILLAAHYDTRRLADRDGIDPSAPVPGANDGASGTSVLIELARVIPGHEFACDIRLAFFDAEDGGGAVGWEFSLGARHMASTLTDEPQAVVVLDMVGDRDLRLPIEGNSTPELVEAIWSAAQAEGLTAFVDDPGPSIIDDHLPFIERGWPAVDIIDFTYPSWHTTQDTLDKLSAESLEQVGRGVLAWLKATCGADEIQ